LQKISSVFELNTSFSTGGDQQKAINELKKGLETKKRSVQTLLGVTGSG